MRRLEQQGIVTRARPGTILVKKVNPADRDTLTRNLSKKVCLIYNNDTMHWSDVALNALEQKLAGKNISAVFHPVASDISEKCFHELLREIMGNRPIGVVISVTGGHVKRHLKNMRQQIMGKRPTGHPLCKAAGM